MENDVVHRFGPNRFKLHRMPIPELGEILGLVGSNGLGKSISLKILEGTLKQNLGRVTEEIDLREIKKYYRRSSLQNYF